MRFVTLVTILMASTSLLADDAALLTKQKKSAEKDFESVESGARNRAETAHFSVIGTLAETRLKAIATSLEKTHSAAVKGLEFDEKTPPWPGKLVVQVFNDAPKYRSFVRQVMKRSPQPEESNTADFRGDTPSMVINISAFKDTAGQDAALQQRLASTLLYSRAKTEKLPDWLVAGLSKATLAQGTPLGRRKRQVAKLGLPATAAWSNDLPVEIRNQVAASVVEYLIYAKTVKPGEFLAAFRPETDLIDFELPLTAILEKVKLTPEKIDAGWRQWLAKP
jgi:hypothetical protein